MSKIYILNTTIITTPGLTYTSRVIGICEAKSLLGVDATDSDRTSDRAAGLHIVTHIPVGPRPAVISAVGHAATATIASEVLGRPVAVDRTPANMQDGDLAVCIKLRGRPPEGAILNREEMEAIGWDIVLVEARDPMHLQRHLTKLERALALISAPDDPAKDGEQTPGTRRRGRAQRRLGLLEAAHRHALARQLGALQEHFIVRLPAPLGGTYHEVMQHYGTEAWEIVDAVFSAAGIS